ncbi:MAG: SPOR domain-containing protein [Candidatus Omnitrophota bacterium]
MHRQLQLELFDTDRDKPKLFKADKYRPNFFSVVRIHEKAILIAIGIIVFSLVSFSLGVEEGKRLTERRTGNREEKNLYVQPSQEEKAGEEKADKSEGEAEPVKKEKGLESKYTIQVATFKTETYAQKEAERLKKRGLEAVIVPRGNFVSVCVGNFSERQEANISLNQLKKTYNDCFVRRL